ncbi:MAG TPA: universal stress protein [Jatrophihabitans sp.]|nr:universal stress protein [Jatrophihabitans sp.]
MNGNELGAVVVGVADTPAAGAALARGVREARQRHAGLRLVRVWREVDLLFSMTRAEVARLASSEQANKLLLERAAWQARSQAPDLRVAADLLPGDLFETLAGVSKDAQLLVIGSDTPDSDSEIATWLRQHALCPVLVVEEASASTPAP